MVEIVISIASKVAEYLVAPVGHQLGYLVHYDSNMTELRDEVERLDEARKSLQLRVAEATRHGKGILPDVQNWVIRAIDISNKAHKFIEDENKATKSCFEGLCPNLISRYQLSRQAKEKALDVKKSQGEGHFQTISYRLPLPGAGTAPPQGYQAFVSRASTLNEVMNAIKDDKMKMIGVWGMGGVGKTTLVKEVAKLAEDGKSFDKVVMVAVPREQNLRKIQSEIADLLDLKIEEESESGRARRLFELLKEKKVLIILDDIWAKLDLEAVGIPHGDDLGQCKILMTSRRIDVLSQDMGTQPNFEVQILSNEEAWQLFQKTAGGIPEFDVQSVARKVAEKCGGLPIALVTVAKALKNKSLSHWEDALRQLRSPVKTDIRGMDENVYKSLELSYNSLEYKDDAKRLFLLCGLMGYGDISMSDLFKCSLGLGLFQSINTLDGSTNRLQVLVDHLKSSSLLLDINKEEYVKMHDIVRDVARQLASEDPLWFVVIEATQSNIHESTRYIPLSLSHEGTLDLGERLARPEIQFLLLHNKGPLKIPDPLFNGMGKLKVLHLFQMQFPSLPLSLQSLANLRTLCLHCCTLGDVAGIGELKKLEVLSFRGSYIVQLPREIAQLTCLRWLDLSRCRELQVIPPNILSELSQLEHLCMKPSSFTLLEDEEINQESNACLAELKHLSRLTTLNIALQYLTLLPRDMVFENLTGYKIFIGGWWDLDYSPCETKRVLKLYKADRSLHLVDGIDKLLKNTEELCLREMSGTQSVFYDKEAFCKLKHLDVSESPEIQYIVDPKYPRIQEHALFPSLESLHLDDLINLEKVCHGPMLKGSFGNLKTLEVSRCHGLKILLSLTMATGFLHLQKIQISGCDVMQQIMAYERESEIIEEGHAGTTSQPFPKLRSLELVALPELMNFSSELGTSSMSLTTNARLEGNHTSFFNHQVLFPNLEGLHLYDLPKLKEIWHHQLPLGSFYNLQILYVQYCPYLLNLIPPYLIHSLNHLKSIYAYNCEVLEHVFDLQGLDENIRILPKLDSLWLWNLPRLRCITRNEDKNDNVRCLFSPSTLMDFHNLQFLSIKDCGNEVENEGHVNTLAKDVVLFSEKVSLPNLKELKLSELSNLEAIWHHQLSLDSFSNLQILNVEDCEVLEHIFLFVADGREKASFPNLKELEFSNLPKLKEIWHHQRHHQLSLDCFSNLQILKVNKCPGLVNLIPCHLIQSFRNLKEIEVSDCEVLKHVFDIQGLDRNVEILPKLETLTLEGLPGLRCVMCNEDKHDNMRCLFSPSTPMNFHNLKYLSIKYRVNEDKDEVHVNTPIEDVVLFGEKVSFPNLEKLELCNLPKLKKIWDHQLTLDSFSNLQILKVENCPGLSNLISCHLRPSFKNLREIYYTSTNDVVLFNEKVSFPDGESYEAFESRASTLNKIMDALRDGKINLIGVWGMGGVGKTTLVKQVAQKANQLQLFTKQLYIDVSWARDSEKLQQGISDIQQNIANKLGFWWKYDKSRMAFELKKRLQKEKILIILDDLWEKVDLEEVGIPSKDDAAECKIVLTSRDEDLLCKDMGVQECFSVEQLPPEEARSLFKKTAGDSMKENVIQVVEECEGLPIAIVTIAKALKDETVAVWKNVLEELRSFVPTNIRGVGNKVNSCLEWSYTHLKGDDVKSLFLLCGMLGYDDISVDLLLQYCLGLDMFDHIDSLEQATNKLLTLVQILKASNLLFFNADNNSVRMHDVVSDVSRAIASKDPHPFIVREDVGFEDWSETDESKRCTFISLNCKLMPELPHRLVCLELQIFLLQNNNPSLNIPNTFFEGMKKLKVLDLSKMNFWTTLPSSLDSLANLRTLRLDGCTLVDIALIGKLTKLEVLSLVGSTIQQLPEEMVQLTNLRLLDLNDCKELKVIPRNILSSLSRLECLYMKSSFIQWADEGESNACLSELNHLSHLTTLDIDIPDAKVLPKDILFENLTRYTISIGDFMLFGRDWKTKRALTLTRVLYLGDAISKLLERSEELELSGTKYVLYPSDRESFLELKHLTVYNSREIQYIIDSKDQRFLQHGAFPLLESLRIWSLDNLEEVWHGPIPIGSFGKLKTLKMSSCPKLKFLFVLSTARGLSQLEEMKIGYCDVMQQIIACERESEIKEDGHGGTNLQLFPKLRTLELRCLPELINFSSGLETSSTSSSTNAMSEGSFFNHQISLPILEKLTLVDLPKLKDRRLHQLLFTEATGG